jgi:diaminohydroxyphosphoribosylaminopyrimidine deaminase / 5-amino-6-(5-phosphoribosylamino)uracil reductase
MSAAIALSERARGLSTPNPSVGCIIVRDDHVVGRGVTAQGGRPHAEAIALGQAGKQARSATVYVTLEPCAHMSDRGPACADMLIMAGVARVIIAVNDPDPRTNGLGIARLRAAGIEVIEAAHMSRLNSRLRLMGQLRQGRGKASGLRAPPRARMAIWNVHAPI